MAHLRFKSGGGFDFGTDYRQVAKEKQAKEAQKLASREHRPHYNGPSAHEYSTMQQPDQFEGGRVYQAQHIDYRQPGAVPMTYAAESGEGPEPIYSGDELNGERPRPPPMARRQISQRTLDAAGKRSTRQMILEHPHVFNNEAKFMKSAPPPKTQHTVNPGVLYCGPIGGGQPAPQWRPEQQTYREPVQHYDEGDQYEDECYDDAQLSPGQFSPGVYEDDYQQQAHRPGGSGRGSSHGGSIPDQDRAPASGGNSGGGAPWRGSVPRQMGSDTSPVHPPPQSGLVAAPHAKYRLGSSIGAQGVGKYTAWQERGGHAADVDTSEHNPQEKVYNALAGALADSENVGTSEYYGFSDF